MKSLSFGAGLDFSETSFVVRLCGSWWSLLYILHVITISFTEILTRLIVVC